MKMARFLEKLQNFKLLPLFVLLSMAVGIGIGKIYGISNFELTPPIDAIVAIFQGTYTFSLANTLALGVVVGLFLMMYPAMTNIKFEDLGRSLKSPKQLLVVLFFNFAIAIAITAFNPTVALATVVGPLIEVPVMLVLVWFARVTKQRLFGELAEPVEVVAAAPKLERKVA